MIWYDMIDARAQRLEYARRLEYKFERRQRYARTNHISRSEATVRAQAPPLGWDNLIYHAYLIEHTRGAFIQAHPTG